MGLIIKGPPSQGAPTIFPMKVIFRASGPKSTNTGKEEVYGWDSWSSWYWATPMAQDMSSIAHLL